MHFDLAPQRLAVKVHRRTTVGPHAHHGARFDELLDAAFPEQHLAVGPLKVSKRRPVLQRVLHLGVDIRREQFLQCRILEPFGKRRGVGVDPAPMGGGDDDRAPGVDDVANQLGRVGRRRAGRSDVLQDIDARLERIANILFGIDVRVHLDLMPARHRDDRFVILESEP